MFRSFVLCRQLTMLLILPLSNLAQTMRLFMKTENEKSLQDMYRRNGEGNEQRNGERKNVSR